MTYPHPENPTAQTKTPPAPSLSWRRDGLLCMVSEPPGYTIAKVGGLYEVSRGPHVALACPGCATLDEAKGVAQGHYARLL